jgi:hypothetical protein
LGKRKVLSSAFLTHRAGIALLLKNNLGERQLRSLDFAPAARFLSSQVVRGVSIPV